MLEKAATIKRLEYFLLDKELKAQTSAVEKQYQVVNKIFKPGEKEEPVTIKKEEPVTIKKPRNNWWTKFNIWQQV